MPVFGKTPPLRLVYCVAPPQDFDDLDRRAIRRHVRLIQDFYRHFGLELPAEDVVYELRASTPGPAGYEYHAVQEAVRAAGLYAAGRTVVFVPSDAGLGGGMALARINDANVERRECPGGHGDGPPWWCGYPERERWGGAVHEVGHMLGLEHTSDPRSVMARHYRFLKDPDVGLTRGEVEELRRRFGGR